MECESIPVQKYFYSSVSFGMTSGDLEWLSEIFSDVKLRAACLRQLSFLSIM